ncbi:MAG TPA: isoprenylcysteine carboxylmethyltransferase family protein, partial [Candidatus Dormibacteraeota bacterium]|nr:isoprenylcysteine carboxylmethyltransferase family protein [Candidatus Dormibacteraeota bacterium]
GREWPAAAPRTYPVMVALHVGLFTWPLARRWHRPAPAPAAQAAAVATLLAATGLRTWAIHSLGGQWNVEARVPPHLDPVRHGPYRFVRHPNYVAVALEMAALPAACGAYREAAALSLANAAVLWPRIRGEEGLLLAQPAYREAFAGVPRFLPRWRRRGSALASGAGPRGPGSGQGEVS